MSSVGIIHFIYNETKFRGHCPLYQSITIDSQELCMEREIYMWHVPCALGQILTHCLYRSHFLAVGGSIGVLFARLFLRYGFPKVVS